MKMNTVYRQSYREDFFEGEIKIRVERERNEKRIKSE